MDKTFEEDDNMKNRTYIPREKPSPFECPKEFCFFWCEKNSSFAPGLYTNLEEAMQAAKIVHESFCSCSFGICLRNPLRQGERDRYEPHEPNLDAAGLPHFYFISNPARLNQRKKKLYQQYFKDKEKQ
ncbi:hypothetical protein [Acetonema longum]|uniref:Uncharacterized protein n=1 Tax=Acetonema longum DSM 6540 TaxID=1009370 RepID=F7NGV0_9FIRM|nr:hypothetical protein [Acetonema longum]EGO64681.1 hypothetical protein ALO_06458 [Acetonema longum DSM 6540]